mmetsp:Transcript_7312/g.23942  ORF Transcript_7312/g.23942 Transcript_7312/m.23942 type:complete len:253 (-) Transcript_7312:99-857(-)
MRRGGLVLLALLLVPAWAYLQGSTGSSSSSQRQRRRDVAVYGGRRSSPLGRASTPSGKEKCVAEVSDAIAESTLLFAFDGAGLDFVKIEDLRSKLPEDSKARMVKNTLFKIAGAESGWEEETLGEAAKFIFSGSSLWVFCGEDLKGTMKAYDDWIKANNLKEGYDIKGGFLEGSLIDEDGVKKAIDLPTKPELMARLAGGINLAGPLGLATKLQNAKGNPRGLAVRLKKAAGGKLATALKISVADEDKNLLN